MEDNRENGMPNLLDLEEFDEEALKKESEEVLQMRLLTADNAVFTRTEGGFCPCSLTAEAMTGWGCI